MNAKIEGMQPAKIQRLDWLLLISLIFISVSPVVSELTRGLVLIALGMVFLVKRKTINKNNNNIMVLLLIIAPLVPMTIFDLLSSIDRSFVTLSFVFIPTSIIVGYQAANYYESKAFTYMFEQIILFFACSSLVLYFVLIFLFPGFISILPTYTYGGFTHKTLYLINILMDSDVIRRNAGFTGEPGVFQFFLNAALYFSLRRNDRLRVESGIYIATIFTTASTAGIIIMMITLLLNVRGKSRYILLLLCLVFSGLLTNYFLGHWESKVLNDYALAGRLLPTIDAANAFLENPLGIGAVRYAEIFQDENLGSWDSYTQTALRYGILGLFALSFALFRINKIGFGLFIIYSLSFITNPMWFVAIISCFYFLAFNNPSKHKSTISKKLSK